MAFETEIAWCDSTFNPWWGCQKLGPGCDHCYAEALDHRTGGAHWGPGVERRRTGAKNWGDPLRWEKAHANFFSKHGRRQRVFSASMADVFDNAVPEQWRRDFFELIASTPHLDWLLLTKRIGNVTSMCADPFMLKVLQERVWLGSTVVNQEEATRDVPKLLATHAFKRFLSMEPLLGHVDLTDLSVGTKDVHINALTGEVSGTDREADATAALDWVIVGGESGPGARPMHPDWARLLRDQCEGAMTPYLFKQWGEWSPLQAAQESAGDARVCTVSNAVPNATEHVQEMRRIGKSAAGRLLNGALYDGFPYQDAEPLLPLSLFGEA